MSIKARKLQGHDSFHRINYLYQISKHMTRRSHKVSAYYGNLIINVAKKNVQKIHPEIKRQICKKCRTILIEGCSATTRIKTVDKVKCIMWTCKYCNTIKKLPIPKNKDSRTWLEMSEAVVEIIEYNGKDNK